MENVKVISIEDFDESDETYDWVKGGKTIQVAIDKQIDIVFSSEPHYSSTFQKLYPNSEHKNTNTNTFNQKNNPPLG